MNEAASACPVCGTEFRGGARFCPKCGTPVPKAARRPRYDVGPRQPGRRRGARPGRKRTKFVRRTAAWTLFRPTLWLFALFLAVSAAVTIHQRLTGETSPLVDVAAVSVLSLIILLFARLEWRRIRLALSHCGMKGPQTLLIPGALLLAVLFLTLYLAGLRAIGVKTIDYLQDFREHGWPLVSAIGLICVWPAVFEEMAFRGFIQGRLTRIVGPRDALLVQAAFFSVAHLNPLVFVSHFVMGLILGWLRQRTRSLYPGMFVHAVWNGVVLAEEITRNS